jgi:hypothetical protein
MWKNAGPWIDLVLGAETPFEVAHPLARSTKTRGSQDDELEDAVHLIAVGGLHEIAARRRPVGWKADDRRPAPSC